MFTRLRLLYLALALVLVAAGLSAFQPDVTVGYTPAGPPLPAVSPYQFAHPAASAPVVKPAVVKPKVVKHKAKKHLRPKYHRVRYGESIFGIASKYHVWPSYICHLNRIKYPRVLKAGTVLRLRGKPTWTGKIYYMRYPPGYWPKPAPAPAPVRHYTPPAPRHVYTGTLFSQGAHGQLDVPVYPYFISKGVVWGHVALDFAGPYGSPIHSVDSGTVIATYYWNYSYGYHVLVQHSNGYSTLYAHMASIYVSPGQHVYRGQTLGTRDSTGHSTGNHLHFEIRYYGHNVNPGPWLW